MRIALVRLGAVDLDPFPFATAWADEAPAELLETLPPAERHLRETLDARIILFSPENVVDGAELAAERRLALRRAVQPFQERVGGRPWVSCPFPTLALAQDARLTLAQYADVLYAACLRDWDAEGERMRHHRGAVRGGRDGADRRTGHGRLDGRRGSGGSRWTTAI